MYYLLVYCQYICLRIELDFCDTPLYRTLYFLQFLLCYAHIFCRYVYPIVSEGWMSTMVIARGCQVFKREVQN